MCMEDKHGVKTSAGGRAMGKISGAEKTGSLWVAEKPGPGNRREEGVS